MQLIFAAFRRFLPPRPAAFGILAALIVLPAMPAHAAGLIRDAEIEHTLREFSEPIFEANGLTPSSIRMYIVGDDTVNAFVMGGSNIFIHTGLILRAPEPGMLIGVIAHETGHIAGGHLVRASQAMEKAKFRALMSSLLGAAAMAGGAGDVGAAIMSAGQNTAMRGLLSYTRSNEQAADQAALMALDKLKISSSGLMNMFEVLRKLENRKLGDPDPYMQTHPLGTDRIMHVRAHVESSPIPVGAVPAGYKELHERMLGKLEGFLQQPDDVLARYPATDISTRARYARAVAYFRLVKTAQALAEMDALLAQSPSDGYFHELKGQILFESGKVAEARQSYAQAVKLLPNEPLILSSYAGTLLAEPSSPEMVKQAITNLEMATTKDTENPTAWRQLGTAYGKSSQMDQSHLALAEEALLMNKPQQAVQQLDFAKKYIKSGTPAALRAEDLRTEAKDREKDLKDTPKS